MAYFAIDYGESKIGLAVADESGYAISPLKTVPNNPKELAKTMESIQQELERWQPHSLVFGLPLSPSGEETEACAKIRKFADKLNEFSGKNYRLDFYPEYYSTKMGTQGLSRKQKQVSGDAYAAAYILRSYLEWQKEKNNLNNDLVKLST